MMSIFKQILVIIMQEKKEKVINEKRIRMNDQEINASVLSNFITLYVLNIRVPYKCEVF